MRGSTALVWFRRDLRLADNPALSLALAQHQTVIPVYIHDPDVDHHGVPGAASRWWLHRSLLALDQELRRLGSRLQIIDGPAVERLPALARHVQAHTVTWNRLYEPASVARDATVEAALTRQGVAVSHHPGALLAEPTELHTATGTPYRVYTPYWKAHRRDVTRPLPLEAPAALPAPPDLPGAISVDHLDLLPAIPWYAGLADHWCAGERGAFDALAAFDCRAIGRYGEDRDRPDHAGTSRLSPHLHFGEITPGQVALAIQNAASDAAAEPFLRQLVWRDFAHHLLHHFPHTVTEPFNPRFAAFPWRQDAAEDLERWQRGRTGIPLVDAGMRELWHTGWMHNRVRMAVASLLTKNLLIHWRQGEAWFRDTLVDADVANNVMGWQWTAGSGADAAPYFRIFNPVRQGQRFDPKGLYVRRWVPELAGLPDRYLHCPWEAPATALQVAGVTLDREYPAPMVDLKASRERALEAYGEVKGGMEKKVNRE
ncbi:MAG: deoxyribodipyrimidine photo-lyase [Gammaproteobacteria bacterium]|nr:deoxyribodipyrimidine photo-lyase [Gammaproteobacteria bacterium]